MASDLARYDTRERMPPLEEVLQRLYDSEINVTIAMLWDGGFDFAFDDLESFVTPKPPITLTSWRNCRSARELPAAIHEAALEKYPQSDYAETYGRRN